MSDDSHQRTNDSDTGFVRVSGDHCHPADPSASRSVLDAAPAFTDTLKGMRAVKAIEALQALRAEADTRQVIGPVHEGLASWQGKVRVVLKAALDANDHP